MIGIVICGHGNLASEFLNALEFISGKQEGVKAIAVDHVQKVESAQSALVEAIKEVDEGDGALVMTDLFGGTPSNLAMPLLDKYKIEIIAGISLPMLIKALSLRNSESLRTAAHTIKEYGQKNIFIATEILAGKQKST